MKYLIPSNIVLLLTGTVNVYGKHFTKITDAGQRKQAYINTLQYYLDEYPFPIVFVENSNEDLSMFFKEAIDSNRLELLFFDGNHYPADMGKGFGEMICVQHGVMNAQFIREESFVFKITGRYRIENFKKFIGVYTKNPGIELLADLTGNFRFSSAAIFGFRPFFARQFLFKNAPLLNDQHLFYFEHALAKAVLEAIGAQVKFHIFKHYPIINALSGTTATPYNISFLYMLPRHIKYWIRYYIVIR